MMMVRTENLEELQLPCIPTHPDILVSLTANGEDVTDQFQYDPTRGFWPGPRTSTTSTTFTCYFSLAGQTESLSVKVVSREWERVGEEEVVEVTLTSQTKQEELQLVCKIFTPEDSPVEMGGRGEESSGPPHCHQGGGCLWEEDQVAAGTRQNKTLGAAQHWRSVQENFVSINF